MQAFHLACTLTIADSLGSRLGHEGSHYSVHAVLIEVVQEERLLHSLLNREEGGRNQGDEHE